MTVSIRDAQHRVTDSAVVEFSTTQVVIDQGTQGGEVVMETGKPGGPELALYIPCDALCSGLYVHAHQSNVGVGLHLTPTRTALTCTAFLPMAAAHCKRWCSSS